MSIKTIFVAQELQVIVSNMLSPQERSEAVAKFARGQIADADSTNTMVLGRLPVKKVTVDGRLNGALESVNPDDGFIVAEWELTTSVLQWIGKTLIERSPVVSGKYRDSHTLFADGTEVLLTDKIPPANEYTFLNPLPYARKIEIGKTKEGRAFVVQVPNMIYERTAEDAKARFGNAAVIKFVYAAPIGGRIMPYVPVNKASSASTRSKAAHERQLRVPAITVTLRRS
jgi:hypothetical protein